jgi:flagellar motor switch protein FliN/FliY
MKSSDEIRAIADVPVQFEVELDRVLMTIRQILELEIGTVLKLNRSAGENVEIVVGGARVGFGEIVVIEEMMGVRLTDFALEV